MTDSEHGMTCEECGSLNPFDNKFCEQCGRPLDADSIGQPIAAGPPKASVEDVLPASNIEELKEVVDESVRGGAGIVGEELEKRPLKSTQGSKKMGPFPVWVWGAVGALVLAGVICVGLVGGKIITNVFDRERPIALAIDPTKTKASPPTAEPTLTSLPTTTVILPSPNPKATSTPTEVPTLTPTNTPAPADTAIPTSTFTPVPVGGGVNLNGYCQEMGFTEAALVEDTAYGWRCRDWNGDLYDIDMWSVCEWQYGGGTPNYADFNEPYSWTCDF
jgi:hypothetical protein